MGGWWSGSANESRQVACLITFCGTMRKTNEKKISVNPALVGYSTRHTFITRALLAGWYAGKVAAYCGTSEAMIRSHYGHLCNEVEEMERLANSVASL